MDDEVRLRSREHQTVLEERTRSEMHHEDQRRQLESALEACDEELSSLRLKLSASEGRVGALEEQLARIETGKRDVESKLGSIVSSLRRTIGFGPGESGGEGMLQRDRSLSPQRQRPISPTKGWIIFYFLNSIESRKISKLHLDFIKQISDLYWIILKKNKYSVYFSVFKS